MSAWLTHPGFIAALTLVAGEPASACPEWQSVAAESQLHFFAKFEGADAPGTFKRFDVCLELDPAEPVSGRLEVHVDIRSADMDSADLNEAIAEPEWFDTGAFPQARFVSEDIEAAGEANFVARGELELKGVRRPVDVPFVWRELNGAATMSGEVLLERTAFGIGSGAWAEDESIGHEVTVRFSVVLERAR